jgi:uncharacterized RDD family membrane protein YckC
MQEIQELFSSCREEIEISSKDVCFELGSEHFISERDYEEIKVLFNLARISIENPDKQTAGDNLFTSDLRKISSEELEKVLTATEKAIEIPEISLSAIKQENARKLSKYLGGSDERDGTFLFKAHAKKIISASMSRRAISFCVDFICSAILAAVLTKLAIMYQFSELQNPKSFLPVISLFVTCLCLANLIFPALCQALFKNTPGLGLCGIKVVCKNLKNPGWQRILLRSALFPLSLISFSIFNMLFGREALHDFLASTQVVK